jgi:hypothetical protein
MKKLIIPILLATAFLSGLTTQQFVKIPSDAGNPAIAKVYAQSGNFEYVYPQVTPCDYRWNMLQRIYKVTGVWPVDCPDLNIDGSWHTVPRFNVELSPAQITSLTTLMTGETPCNPPPPTGTKYQFVDIYENRALLASKFAITNFWVWYANGGSSVYIYFDNNLSQGDKNKVKSEFANLFQEF